MPRILIVEPDPALAVALARTVRAAGWSVEHTADADTAVSLLATRAVDVALVDVREAQGCAAIERMVRAAPGVALLAMGAGAPVERAVEAMKRGARDFLRKPFAVGALEAALDAALAAAGAGARSLAAGPVLLTEDPGMLRLLRQASAAAATDATVQIVGESGTGKDLLARLVHRASPRRHGPYAAVNCAGLPEQLAESELFGHERGAFTGAVESRPGQIAAADGGSLLLDEVGELAPALQPKLLRVLQEREVMAVGAVAPRAVDVRILATSRRDLADLVAEGRFREDLYYRLDVIVLHVPPLRERPGDVPLLARHFLERFAEQAGVEPPRFAARDLDRLAALPLPGNVRELENLMRRAVVLFAGREVDLDRLLARRTPAPAPSEPVPHGLTTLNLRELERIAILRSLAQCGGNRTRASEVLGISVRTLRNKLRAYELS